MTQLAIRQNETLARPLKVLVPLIKEEIELGDAAGLDHYRAAGEMLIEAKEQVEHGEWRGWVERNFALSYSTATRYMKLAEESQKKRPRFFSTLSEAHGDTRETRSPVWHEPVREIIKDRVTPNLEAIAQERQDKEKELQLVRKLANQLIDIGYKVLASQLHPDKKGGSHEAMSRLNRVKQILKQAI